MLLFLVPAATRELLKNAKKKKKREKFRKHARKGTEGVSWVQFLVTLTFQVWEKITVGEEVEEKKKKR